MNLGMTIDDIAKGLKNFLVSYERAWGLTNIGRETDSTERKIDPSESPQTGFIPSPRAAGTPETEEPLARIPEITENDTELGKYARFLPIAYSFAAMSKYPGTRVGCIILGKAYQVLSSGWNGAPRGSEADVDGRLGDRDTRLSWACHAEANAIANAARSGTALDGATLICTLMPCMACAKSIVQSGIIRVLCPPPDNPLWEAEFKLSRDLFNEVGVDLVHIDRTGE